MTAMLFFVIALLNVLTGIWWLAVVMALVGALNVRRAFLRRRAGV